MQVVAANVHSYVAVRKTLHLFLFRQYCNKEIGSFASRSLHRLPTHLSRFHISQRLSFGQEASKPYNSLYRYGTGRALDREENMSKRANCIWTVLLTTVKILSECFSEV